MRGDQGDESTLAESALLEQGNIFKCWDNLQQTAIHSELGASAAIFMAGYSIDCLMLRYQAMPYQYLSKREHYEDPQGFEKRPSKSSFPVTGEMLHVLEHKMPLGEEWNPTQSPQLWEEAAVGKVGNCCFGCMKDRSFEA